MLATANIVKYGSGYLLCESSEVDLETSLNRSELLKIEEARSIAASNGS